MSQAGYELFNNLQELERSRLTKAWSSKQQMAKAFSAYEANIMMGTAAGSEV